MLADEDRVGGLTADAVSRAAGGGTENSHLEVWLVRAPMGFDLRTLDKQTITLGVDGRVASAEMALPGGATALLREGTSGGEAQTVMFVPSGKKDGDMVVAKPFARQLDIIDGLPKAPAQTALAGVTHPAYSRVPQLSSMAYRLNERLFTARSKKRRRDDEAGANMAKADEMIVTKKPRTDKKEKKKKKTKKKTKKKSSSSS